MSVADEAVHRFRLYVAGEAVNSACALANLQALCRTHLERRHAIEVVDVFSEPERAAADGIFMTPTLVRLSPLPVRKVIGTLSDTATLLRALNLPEPAAAARIDP
ncbi:circadian clock KaiB family protein [Rhizobacter fulvus]|jgi:circadian clock protein KaiB